MHPAGKPPTSSLLLSPPVTPGYGLYHYLDHVGDNALNFDTDSVVYKWQPGEPEIPLGNFLSEMTDELGNGKGNRYVIVEFLSCSPKNYAYRTGLGKTEVKIRGVHLEHARQQQFHVQSMKDTLLRELREPLPKPRTLNVPNPHFIKRQELQDLEHHPTRQTMECRLRQMRPRRWIQFQDFTLRVQLASTGRRFWGALALPVNPRPRLYLGFILFSLKTIYMYCNSSII